MIKQKSKKNYDQKYLQKIKNVDFKPIFILGVERSGTSILYKILSETKSFNVFTAYNLFQYDKILYNHEKELEHKSKEEFNNLFSKDQKTRIIDDLEISADFPEEYRFVFYKNYGESTLNPKTQDIFNELCKKILYISDNDKPILLKNPDDFTNFKYIKSVFPDSKIIFIHRNPVDTLNSYTRAKLKIARKKSIYLSMFLPLYNRVHDNKLAFFLSKILYVYPYYSPLGVVLCSIPRLRFKTNYYLKNINSLNRKDFISISYEKLCKQPKNEIKKIFDFLEVKPQKKLDYEDYIKPRNLKALKQVAFCKKLIFKKMKEYIEYVESL